MALAARHLASISDEKLQELRDRVDLVAVVQRRVPLKKSGHDWKGLCPFHEEKTYSFYVVRDKKMFHCFGCGVSGDAIKFVMQTEGRSFREAVEQLANEAGVDLTPPDAEEARRSARRAALGEVNEKACTFYERILWEHPKGEIAREHLRQRGITEDTARAWRLGYAPNLWDSLIKSHALKGVDLRLVEEAGLGVPRKKGEGLYDRFRGRLTIPIRESGRIVGFGGRLLEGQSEAKYLNSPDTALYQKGHTLFALDRAREPIRREGVALFVECSPRRSLRSSSSSIAPWSSCRQAPRSRRACARATPSRASCRRHLARLPATCTWKRWRIKWARRWMPSHAPSPGRPLSSARRRRPCRSRPSRESPCRTRC